MKRCTLCKQLIGDALPLSFMDIHYDLVLYRCEADRGSNTAAGITHSENDYRRLRNTMTDTGTPPN